jgi:hypothetical protein
MRLPILVFIVWKNLMRSLAEAPLSNMDLAIVFLIHLSVSSQNDGLEVFMLFMVNNLIVVDVAPSFFRIIKLFSGLISLRYSLIGYTFFLTGLCPFHEVVRHSQVKCASGK